MDTSARKLQRQVKIVETIKTRDELQEVVDFLAAHDSRYDRSERRIAWNIKVHDYDLPDEVRKEFSLEKKWDDRWEEALNNDYNILDRACQDGLGFIGDEKSQHYNYIEGHEDKDLSTSNYVIWQAGRSGGWLELHSFNGTGPDIHRIRAVSEGGMWSFQEYCDFCTSNKTIKDSDELDQLLTAYIDEYLGEIEGFKLLKLFVEEVDKFDAGNELRYQLGFQRQQLEEEWQQEFEDKVMEESFAVMDTAA